VRRAVVTACVAAAALALPAAAWAHAALLKTVPAASAEVNTPPKELRLVYDEVIEPRFAVVSVTDARGHQQIDGAVHRSGSNPYELDAPLRRSTEGWYLVFWRVISADGHPVRGAFTYRIGPNPGPPPQFVIPSLSETAVTPGLVTLRWLTFLSAMAAIGLFVLRAVIARPVVRGLRALSAAFGIAVAVGLVVTPIYVLLATAQFALRSFWSFGALVPLMDTSAFGRGYLRLELLLALFGLAAAAAIWLDRPERSKRSVVGLLSLWGALLAAAAVLLVPGTAGHAAQTSPRALSLVFDWLHLAGGSLWIGGLIGLLVLARRGRPFMVALKRFSNVALVSVVVLLGAGIGASVIHLPTLAALWQTGYGKAILVKAGLLLAAMLIASVNLVRTRRSLVLLWQLVAAEVVLVTGAIVAAAVLSSLPPPPKALASLGAPAAHIGPGPVSSTVERNGYRLAIRVTPNKVAMPDDFAVRITRNGTPVRGATVIATFAMLDMEMPTQAFRLDERSPGLYEHSSAALVMVGRWGLTFEVEPQGARPFSVVVVDRANG
jgi:copper transport protein